MRVPKTSRVRVLNLPTTAGQKDIENMFAGFAIVSIHTQASSRGGWGATIEFSTPEEATRAVATKHLSRIGSNRIKVELDSS